MDDKKDARAEGGSRFQRKRSAIEKDLGLVLFKILSKSISITNYKIHLKNAFQLLLSITLAKQPKIQNTFDESN